MAYVTTNPPRLISQDIGGDGGGNLWFYTSADAATLVRVADYFTNGLDLGMEVGDIVFVYDNDAPALTIHFVISVDSDGADLTDGQAIDATNSD